MVIIMGKCIGVPLKGRTSYLIYQRKHNYRSHMYRFWLYQTAIIKNRVLYALFAIDLLSRFTKLKMIYCWMKKDICRYQYKHVILYRRLIWHALHNFSRNPWLTSCMQLTIVFNIVVFNIGLFGHGINDKEITR